MAATKYVLRPYLYADGIAYRPNLKLIHVLDENGHLDYRVVGGAIILKDKVLAFAGHGSLVNSKPRDVIAHADAYAWGATLTEAVMKIRPQLAS